MVTNHLDKIFDTHSKFPGVQLKRSKTNQHSYQVEVKVRGAVPSRNINFGTYDSLERAKRAYNYGSYILYGKVDDLPYFSRKDNRKLEAICPEPLREQLKGYIMDRNADKIIEMRNQYIKKYVADCQCAEDSSEFRTRVRAYWRALDMSRGQVDPALLPEDDAQGPGNSPAHLQPPDLTEGDTNAMHEEAHCDTGEANVDQHESEGTAEENRTANNMHDEPERRQAMDGIFVHQEEQNVLISNHAQMRGFAFRNKRSSGDAEYSNLPKHYYGIITHTDGIFH
ncbi:hypothetical protein KP509_12G057800 [Ceratopteris richardii]|uniref:AP2/ERF domain-containing protein n=1 Tax=Ceratopteris richardii TaxID=49495 RepID=A0A8T2TJD3_CERRI|nr:hypothetical protein KP509_12G057800 [Ceratopteris richardii]